MFKSIYHNKVSVFYQNLRATLHQLPQSKAVIQFDNENIPEVILSHQELEEELALGRLQFTSRKKSPKGEIKYSAQQKIEIARRKAYVTGVKEQSASASKGVGGLAKRKRIIAQVADLIGDEEPPSPSTLAVWCRAENENTLGAAHDLMTRNQRKRKSTFDEEVQMCTLEAIDEQLAGNLIEKVNLTELHREITKKINRINDSIRVPSYTWVKTTFKKLIWEFMPRSGLKATELKALARNAIRKFQVEYPLERVEADGVYLQVGILDENGSYAGAVTLIFIIDVKTRVILGYSARVGRGESSSLVIQAIRHALCTKASDSFHSKQGNKWPFYGSFSLFCVDGGTAFTSSETNAFLARTCGTLIEYIEVAAGWLKPFIERFNLTLRMKFAAKMPGYVGPMEDQQKLEYSLKDKAVLTFDEFKRHLESWIVDDYHHTPHSGLKGKTPAEAWQDALDKGWCPELPPGYEQIALPAGKVRYATISGDKKGSYHLGVQVENVRYNDSDRRLKDIARHLTGLGEKPVVRCEYDDIDISKISVLDPRTDELFIVPTVDPDIPVGTTREVHQRELKKMQQLMARKAPNSLGDDEELNKLRADQAAKSRGKQRRRQRESHPDNLRNEIHTKFQEHTNQSNIPYTASSVSNLTSPLDDIELDDDDILESD